MQLQRDEILAMAVSNGFYKNDEGTITSPFIEDVDISELLLGFAEDVAAKERADEREACAKVCEAGINNATDWDSSVWDQACENRSYAIRARGEQHE